MLKLTCVLEYSKEDLLLAYIKEKKLLSLFQLCLLLTLIFPWTKLVMSSFESNTDKVFITLCSNHSQCSVISSLLDPIEK